MANGFKLFFSFDYLGSGVPWETGDIVTLLKQYGWDRAYYKVGRPLAYQCRHKLINLQYNGKPFVSTFEGPTNSDVGQWATIRQQVPIYFVPDWSSQGPGFEMDLYDGAFSWDMWPKGPNNMTMDVDKSWQGSLQPAKKTYMMGMRA